MPSVEYFEDSDYTPQDLLERFEPKPVTPSPILLPVVEPVTADKLQRSLTPSREQLFPGIREPDQDLEHLPPSGADSSMAEPAEPEPNHPFGEACTAGRSQHRSSRENVTTKQRKDRDEHELALVLSNESGTLASDKDDLATRERVDSAHGTVKLPFAEPHHAAAQASNGNASQSSQANGEAGLGSLRDSPTLQKHVFCSGPPHSAPLPPLHTTSQGHASVPATSPTSEQLPGFQRMQQLADLATQEVQQNRHQHSQSFGSATSQSPIFQHATPQLASVQTSPIAYQYSALSPTSTALSSAHTTYGSPPAQYASQAYYTDRRTSNPIERMPAPGPPSLPSASSGESHVGATSGSDGYTTSQTTPSDAATMADGTPRVLPPPPGMSIIPPPINIPGIYKCDYPGCTAVPFQTQYLLSSHKNVHSSSRPHYCPEPGCPRGEGGQGFKRKNEMIRHGLVHKSPGYVCPFCPEREHRYPRPDNLQRHVRVHHVGKSRDDPELQAVLSQRIEGSGKARRRRNNNAAAAAAAATA